MSQAAVEDTEVLEQVAFVYCELSIQRWPTWFLVQSVYDMSDFKRVYMRASVVKVS